MEPIRLHMENFCCYSSGEILFDDFSSALIVGKIKDNERFSNGSGKSAIFGAIKYVLFNKSDFSTLDVVIRRGQEYCRVAFDFRSFIDNEIYRIERSISRRVGSEVRLYRKNHDEWSDITQRKLPDAEKEIAKLIKINYKTFCNSVLFSQTDLFGLASLRPGDRKKALKEALQLNVYSKYELAIKKKASDLSKELDKTKTILETIGNPEEDIKNIQDNLNILNQSISKKYELSAIVKKNYEREKENYSTLVLTFETLEKQINESSFKQTNVQDEINKLSLLINEYSKKLSTLKNSGSSMVDEVLKLEGDIKILSSNQLDIKEIKTKLAEITSQADNKRAAFKMLTIKLEELKLPLPSDGECKFCRRKFTEAEFNASLKHIQEEILDIENKQKIVKNELNILTTQENNLTKDILASEAIVASLKEKQQNLVIKNKEISIARALYSEYSDLLENNTSVLKAKQLELETFKKNQSSKNIEEFTKIKSKIDNSKLKIDILNKEVENILKDTSLLSNNIAVSNHKIEQRKGDIQKIELFKQDILSLELKLILHQKVIHAFGPGGIPALITHTILDDFQIETNNLLSELRPGLQLFFSVVKDRYDGDKEDTLEINYILNGYDLEYAQLSNAQKLTVSLALKLGLAAVIKKRLGIDIRLLLIDEVDSSLDDGAHEAFEDGIKKLQKDFKILVITHSKELKNKFTHAILVEQNEKLVSTAKVVTVW